MGAWEDAYVPGLRRVSGTGHQGRGLGFAQEGIQEREEVSERFIQGDTRSIDRVGAILAGKMPGSCFWCHVQEMFA